jgi:hypothetical protein
VFKTTGMRISPIVGTMRSPGVTMTESETAALVEDLRRAKRRWKAIAIGLALVFAMVLAIFFVCFATLVRRSQEDLGESNKAVERQMQLLLRQKDHK